MRIQVTSPAEARKAAQFALLLTNDGKTDLATHGAVGRIAKRVLGRGDWKADFRETLVVYGERDGDRLLLVGLGKEADVDAEKVRRAAAIALSRANGLKARSLGLEIAPVPVEGAALGNAVAEGIVLASYRYPARKQKPADPPPVREVRLAAEKKRDAVESGVERGRVVAEAMNFTRELGDRPGNEMTPSVLARSAAAMAKREGLRCRVLRKDELTRRGMGGILGVAKGSAEPPVLVEMEYRPRRFKRTVCLVGKGITFDTGGISIKPSAAMEEMKYDMCGGGAVFGTLQACARLKPNVRVIGIVPAAENMPGGRAQKPGDTMVTASGLTVEVLNTDAEGRLILADGLHHASTFEPDYVVDIATLTGAIVVALGHDASGLYSNDRALERLLVEAGEESGDRAWPMPLFPEYAEDLKSDFADLKNLGRREGSAGSAAAFLEKFAAGRKWAHLDIAGSAWGGRAKDYLGKNATAAGVRLLVRFLEGLG